MIPASILKNEIGVVVIVIIQVVVLGELGRVGRCDPGSIICSGRGGKADRVRGRRMERLFRAAAGGGWGRRVVKGGNGRECGGGCGC